MLLILLLALFLLVAVWRLKVELQPVFVLVEPKGLMNDGQSWWFEPLIRGKEQPLDGVNVTFVDNLEAIEKVSHNPVLYRFNLKIYPGEPPVLQGWAWKPLVPEHQSYQAIVQTNAGRFYEHLRIESNDGWKYAIIVTNEKTAKILLQCKDKGFPQDPDSASWPKDPPECDPYFSALPVHFSLADCIRD